MKRITAGSPSLYQHPSLDYTSQVFARPTMSHRTLLLILFASACLSPLIAQTNHAPSDANH